MFASPWIVVCALAFAVQEPANDAAAKIATAIAQLGDDDFATRERATEELFKIGEEARAELIKAAQSRNTEIAARASLVIARLNAIPKPAPVRVVRPQPPVDLVAEFRKADDRNKIGVISRLRKPEEFKAVLELIDKEPTPLQKQQHKSFLIERLASAAGELNMTGQIEEAQRLLEVDLSEPCLQVALSILLLTSDRLPAEIEKLKTRLVEKSDSAGWRQLALMQRTAGDLAKAHAAAEKAQDHELASWIAAEHGDWPAAFASHQSSLRNTKSTIKQHSLGVILASFAGDGESLAAQTQALLGHVREAPETAGAAVEALLIAEQQSEALELLKRIAPASAFEVLWRRREYDEAFRLAGVTNSDDIDALWYQTLPYAGVGSPYNHLRSGFAQRVCLALDDVGRFADADHVLELIRDSIRKRRDGGSGWSNLLEAELERGRRSQALADAAEAIQLDSQVRRPPPPPGRPDYVYVSSYPSFILAKLYPNHDQLIRYAWPILNEPHPNDPQATIAKLERLFHAPLRPGLSIAERRALFDEMLSAMPGNTGNNRTQSQNYLQSLARLAELHGDEEWAWRYREQALSLYGYSGEFVTQQRGRQAFDRQDWQHAKKWLQPTGEPHVSSTPHLVQWGALLCLLDREDEGQAHLAKAVARWLVPTAWLTQAETLVRGGKKAESGDAFRTAMRVMLPGERTTFQAALDWGDAASGPSPATAERMWRLGQLESVVGMTNHKLDVLLYAMPRIHIAAARAHLADGQIAAAAREAQLAQQLLPANIHPATTLVPPLDKAGQRELADEVFERPFQVHESLCRQYPGSVYHRVMAARVAARCNRCLDVAAGLIDEALAIQPSRPMLHATRAEVHLARGDRAAATTAAREGLRLEPGNSDCQKILEQAESADP
jgi:hypothetical protein